MDFEYRKNILCIDNYKQIKHLSDDLILFDEMSVYGKNLKVLRLDSYQIIIQGVVEKITLGMDEHDIQNKNEQGRLFQGK